jgi:sugar lactone lactonase YvrE
MEDGELCDDGNAEFGDSCFRCRFRYYFILNAPDLTSGGTVSILRTTRDGPPDVLVGDDGSLNGMYQIAIADGGATLYGLRSDGASDEVVRFSTTTGEVMSRIDIGASALGYDPNARGMVLASDGNLYVGLNAMGSTRLAQVNPDNDNVSEHVDFGSQFDIVDMAADTMNGVYISTGSGGSIEYADVATMAISTFGDGGDGLANPQGITFDPDTDNFWVIDHSGGPPNVFNADMTGTFMPFTTALESVGGTSPALMIDVGGVVTATATEQDRVVGIALLGEVQALFSDMVVSPVDIEKVELE